MRMRRSLLVVLGSANASDSTTDACWLVCLLEGRQALQQLVGVEVTTPIKKRSEGMINLDPPVAPIWYRHALEHATLEKEDMSVRISVRPFK